MRRLPEKWLGSARLWSIVICALFLGSAGALRAEEQSLLIQGEIRIFDGDTLEIGPLLIRLHGIDAPEKGQRCTSRDGGTWRCGASVAKRLDALIDGQTVTCDALDRDPYGRIIARCRAGEEDIGSTLIAEGLAWAFVEYSDEYVASEQAPRDRGLGIWQAETQTAWEFRDDKWNRALAEAPDGKCPIKGNISAKKGKLKIYHTPWSPNYGNTKIDVSKGERWFCDEAQALAAGWRSVAEK